MADHLDRHSRNVADDDDDRDPFAGLDLGVAAVGARPPRGGWDRALSAGRKRRRVRTAAVGVATLLLIAGGGLAIASRGTEPGSVYAGEMPAVTVPATEMTLLPNEPTVDKAVIRQWIAETKAYYQVAVGDPCPPNDGPVPDLVMTLSVTEPAGQLCTVVAFGPLHPGFQGDLGWLPMGDYDEEGNLFSYGTGTGS
jgi:hypothetical protein